MAKRTVKDLHLKYSLLQDDFASAIGKRRTQSFREAISTWSTNQTEENAKRLVEVYVDSVMAYWKKKALPRIDEKQTKGGLSVTVDVVYKKGRKPNTIRLEDNPTLKEHLRQSVGR